jgi:hypothetical protein
MVMSAKAKQNSDDQELTKTLKAINLKIKEKDGGGGALEKLKDSVNPTADFKIDKLKDKKYTSKQGNREKEAIALLSPPSKQQNNNNDGNKTSTSNTHSQVPSPASSSRILYLHSDAYIQKYGNISPNRSPENSDRGRYIKYCIIYYATCHSHVCMCIYIYIYTL